MRERRGGHRQTRGAPEAHARLPRHAPPAGGHGRGGRGQEGPIAIAAGHGRGHRGGGHGGPASPRHHLRGRGQAGPNSADHAASRGRGRRSGDATSASSRQGGGHADHAVRDVRRGGDVSTQQHHHRGRGQASPSSADHAASRGRGRCGGDANSSSPRVAGQASRFADHAASPGRGCGRWGWDSPLFVGGGARGVGVDLGLQARDGGTPNDGGHGAARGSERCGPPSASDQDSVPFVGTGARGVGVDLELQARGGRRPPRADRHREVWVPVLTTANAYLDVRFWMPFVHDGRTLHQFVYIAGDVGEALLNGGGDVWVDWAAAPGWFRELAARVGDDLPGASLAYIVTCAATRSTWEPGSAESTSSPCCPYILDTVSLSSAARLAPASLSVILF